MKAKQPKKKGSAKRAFKRDLSLYLFCIPGIILTFIFSYIPMYGVQLAFRRYNAKAGIWGSPWSSARYSRALTVPTVCMTMTVPIITATGVSFMWRRRSR